MEKPADPGPDAAGAVPSVDALQTFKPVQNQPAAALPGVSLESYTLPTQGVEQESVIRCGREVLLPDGVCGPAVRQVEGRQGGHLTHLAVPPYRPDAVGIAGQEQRPPGVV